MIVFPNCKINIGLNILRKGVDGYHELETIFYPVPFTDILEINEFAGTERSSFIPFTMSGLAIRGDTASNLCMKAYKLLKREFPHLPHIQMHLHKMIPAGSGLGGGSADGAFALLLLNKKFNLGLTQEELIDYARELGSDCPFFIINTPCFALGRGEKLEPLPLDLSAYKIVIVNPGIHIDTGRAFLEAKPAVPEHSITTIITRPIERWKDELLNDFEKIIFPRYREIVEIKDRLYKAGAIYASMSGSGSTVYGIFEKDKVLSLSFPLHYFIKELAG